jgi:hypothetical protein
VSHLSHSHKKAIFYRHQFFRMRHVSVPLGQAPTMPFRVPKCLICRLALNVGWLTAPKSYTIGTICNSGSDRSPSVSAFPPTPRKRLRGLYGESPRQRLTALVTERFERRSKNFQQKNLVRRCLDRIRAVARMRVEGESLPLRSYHEDVPTGRLLRLSSLFAKDF